MTLPPSCLTKSGSRVPKPPVPALEGTTDHTQLDRFFLGGGSNRANAKGSDGSSNNSDIQRIAAMRPAYAVAALAASFVCMELVLGRLISNWDFLDDSIYMQASLKILEHQGCSLTGPYLTVCNYEHTPLVKVLEAISLVTFGWVVPRSTLTSPGVAGDLPNLSSSILWFLSFRFFQIVMGALSIPLIYSIAVKISGNARLALLAAAILLLEPMFTFFSRTAFLDIPMIFFALCAYAVYFGSFRLGPLSENALAGVFFALSFLSKESGVIFIVPLLAYHFAFRETGWQSSIKEALTTIVAAVVVAIVGLQLYDSLAATPFTTFVQQLDYMVEFSNSLACKGLCYFPPSPLDWFFSYRQNFYFDGFGNNLFLLWLVLGWIPMGAFLVIRERRHRATPENRLFIFALLLFVSTFLENELIYLYRGILPWYYLTIVPSLSLGGAYLLTRSQIPRWVRASVFALIIVGCLWAYLIGSSLLAYE
jgi:Dolichyl-phosphate-mannose-protein mannosyltransferase